MNEKYVWEPQVISFDMIDEERLARVRSGEDFGRGAGRTCSYIVHMMHLIKSGRANITVLYIGENHNLAVNYTGRWLYEFARNEGFDISRKCGNILISQPKNQRFIFTGPTNLRPRYTNGAPFYDVFTDVTWDTRYRYFEDIELVQYRIKR